MDKNTNISLLEMVIDINRVGSDEIYYIEKAIEALNINNKKECISNIKEILSFSDRIGSDEIEIFNEVLDNLK